MRTCLAVLSALVLTTAATAETSVGNYPLSTNSSTINLPFPNTVIDINSGATANGNIGVAVIRFNTSSCDGNAFKVKFFRRSGSTLTMTAERGPFPITSSLQLVTLTPPVPVATGDTIGVTELLPCAGTVGQTPTNEFRNAYHFEGDVTTANLDSGNWLPWFALAAYGAESAASEVRTQVILVAGATAGASGASFKTDAFLGNLRSGRAEGRLVYHPAGSSGLPSDPSVPFTVEPQRRATLSNFVFSDLGRTGVGSIDVYTKVGFEAPTAVVRIYDDAGVAGTKGFTLDALRPDEALQPFENAVLFAPATASTRMNVGIRTLEAGEIQFLHLDREGRSRAFVKREYPANYFVQTSLREFTGFDPLPGDQLVVYSQQVAFFAYASLIDNATNDPSVQVAKHLK